MMSQYGVTIVRDKIKIGRSSVQIVHLLANGESDCMLNTVTLKFFEKGHTFTRAYFLRVQTHSIMLSKMKSGSKNVCMIIDDFVKCVENCGVAVLMKPNDLFDHMNEKCSEKNKLSFTAKNFLSFNSENVPPKYFGKIILAKTSTKKVNS